MAELLWFGAGCAVGLLYGWSLWSLVSRLVADMVVLPLMLTWGAVVLRCLGVAAVLFVAMDHGLASGLWALGGFLLARSVWTGAITLHIGPGGKTLPG